MVGLHAKGYVTREQWENIEQKYGEYRTNPTICRMEMIKLIKPLFVREQSSSVIIYRDKKDQYQYDSWGFAINQGGDRICYIHSIPKRETRVRENITSTTFWTITET